MYVFISAYDILCTSWRIQNSRSIHQPINHMPDWLFLTYLLHLIHQWWFTPKLNGFFLGTSNNLPPSFMKTRIYFCNPADRQRNKQLCENITSLEEVIKSYFRVMHIVYVTVGRQILSVLRYKSWSWDVYDVFWLH